MVAPVVEAVGLTKRFGSRLAVDGVAFTVAPRECLGFLGPNGAGKTTTIRWSPASRRRARGRCASSAMPMAPENARAIKARLGVVQQEESLDPDLTVEKNLAVYASYFGIAARDAARARRRAAGASPSSARTRDGAHQDALGRHEAPPDARARAAQRPSAPGARRADDRSRPAGAPPRVGAPPRRSSASGVAMLLTTHYMEEAAQLCDRLMVMDDGRIIAEGTPRRARSRAHVGARGHRGRDRRRPGAPAPSRRSAGRLLADVERVGDVRLSSICTASAVGRGAVRGARGRALHAPARRRSRTCS